jgi:hypothetical protein
MAWSEWNALWPMYSPVWRFHAGWLSCRLKPNKQKAMSLILSDVVYCICFKCKMKCVQCIYCGQCPEIGFKIFTINFVYCISVSCTEDCTNSTQDCKCYEALPISRQEYNSQYTPVVIVLVYITLKIFINSCCCQCYLHFYSVFLPFK